MEKPLIKNGAEIFRIDGGVEKAKFLQKKWWRPGKHTNLTNSPLLKPARWNNITLA
jgi:hypothetical protein